MIPIEGMDPKRQRLAMLPTRGEGAPVKRAKYRKAEKPRSHKGKAQESPYKLLLARMDRVEALLTQLLRMGVAA